MIVFSRQRIALSVVLCLFFVALVLYVHYEPTESLSSVLSLHVIRHSNSPSICGINAFAQQIEDDFLPWRLAKKNITKADIEALLALKSFSGFHIQIRNSSLKATPVNNPTHAARVRSEILRLQSLAQKYGLPDIDFVMSDRDTPKIDASSPLLPLFSLSKRADFADILYPTFVSGRDIPFADEIHSIKAANERYPWQQKLEVAFWRGSCYFDPTHGKNKARYISLPVNKSEKMMNDSFFAQLDLPNVHKESSRYRLVSLSGEHPDLIDAKFAFDCAYPSLKEFGEVTDVVYSDQWPRWKYLVHVDGYNRFSSHIIAIAHTNSLLLKQASPWYEWWYHKIQPFRHFIPLSDDLHDLPGTIRWLRENDAYAQNVANRMRIFVDTQLTRTQIDCYWLDLLTTYASIYSSEPV